ncbi:MAG TPA: histidine triad nucleotide-binding protein [Clostridia bacterium]|nr:histidine triad nucleotide-binding protein [Clostridia bacterium]
MDDCIFCRIAAGTIPSKKVYEDDNVLAFHDIAPAAPVHILVIPKKHITSAIDLSPEDEALLMQVFQAIKKVAQIAGIAQDGFRIVSNVGKNGGQSVRHLHFHVLGGKAYGANFG